MTVGTIYQFIIYVTVGFVEIISEYVTVGTIYQLIIYMTVWFVKIIPLWERQSIYVLFNLCE